MSKITVFTPTLNRAYILSKLYESLRIQTCKKFRWLIVDDGSTDNTQDIVEGWMREQKIEIEYYKQENQGKSMAHNKGVALTRTELFTCVDSDDFLSVTAIDDILKCWSNKKNRDTVGILAYKCFKNGNVLTSMKNKNIETMTLKEGYSVHGLRGDTMLIFRTSVVSKFKFPKFKGERFVPEAYLYDLIDQEGKLIILRKALYNCEYLDDGYTNNMSKLLYNNPKGYLAYINQRLLIDTRMVDIISDTIRYTAMSIASKKKGIIINSIYPMFTIITYPLGYVLYFKKYRAYK